MSPSHVRCVTAILALTQVKVVYESVIVDIPLIKLHHILLIQRFRIFLAFYSNEGFCQLQCLLSLAKIRTITLLCSASSQGSHATLCPSLTVHVDLSLRTFSLSRYDFILISFTRVSIDMWFHSTRKKR